MAIRSPICSVVGHVDHGKSSILDKIRGSAIVKGEAGAITQAIGASIIPLETIKTMVGDLLTSLKMDFSIPGLLFIDTPGHAAFTNLRKRGGNLADIAILVVDIREGLKPQTIESIEILRQYKTPFIVALNKVDLMPGWSRKKGTVLANIEAQQPQVKQGLETKLYEIVGALYEHGLEAERFDRVADYTKQIALIPTSATTGEGISELLMVLTGLAQRFLENCLECDVSGQAKGIILEVKEDRGIGTAVDAIIYDGRLAVGDTIVVGGLNEPLVTRVKALFEPAPLSEMRDKKSRFKGVKSVEAATGVKISAPDAERIVAGMPLMGAKPDTLEAVKDEVQSQVDEVVISTDKAGVVVKADSLGSLEALVRLLKEEGIAIKKASIGNITKKDAADAQANEEKDPDACVVLGFNVKDISGSTVTTITSQVIYTIIDQYKAFLDEQKKKREAGSLATMASPCKIRVLKGYVFRQSNPAILGVEVLAGTLRANTPLMDANGKRLTIIKGMQADKKSVDEAERGKQIAAAFPGVTIGRQMSEDDIVFSDIDEAQFRRFKEMRGVLSEDQKMILKEVAEIKRRENVVWGI